MKTISRTLLIATLMLSTLVGCGKDEKIETIVPTDTAPQTDTLIAVPFFDTVPANIDSFDIRGKWIWARQDTPNRLLMTFRDDSIVVFNSNVNSATHIRNTPYHFLYIYDSAKYRYTTDSMPEFGMRWHRLYLYDLWYNGHLADQEGLTHRRGYFEPLVYDNQQTLFLRYLPWHPDDTNGLEFDGFFVRID